jgi:hypothetical protein
MAKGIKLGVIALENSGKTTIISHLEDALVASTDNKAFTGKVPHFRYSTYNGLDDLIATIETKLAAYEAKFKKLPRSLVIDSVTHLANNMEKYCNDKYTGFNIWSALGKDILAFNSYLEDTILEEGINVIFTSHCQFNPDTTKYQIAAPGNFGKNGSWLSVTDNAIFLEVKGNKRIVHNTTMKFPCRSNLADIPESMDIVDYDINAHIEALEQQVTDSEEWSI